MRRTSEGIKTISVIDFYAALARRGVLSWRHYCVRIEGERLCKRLGISPFSHEIADAVEIAMQRLRDIALWSERYKARPDSAMEIEALPCVCAALRDELEGGGDLTGRTVDAVAARLDAHREGGA
jgi:hypothetical protein